MTRPLRQRIAHAINRYDYQHALSGNDIPSKHHYGEADFVLAELRAELTLTDPEVRRQLAAVIRALGKSETALARVREYLGRHAHRVAVAPIDVLAVLNGSRDPAEEWAPDSPPIVGIVPPIDEPGPEETDTTQPGNEPDPFSYEERERTGRNAGLVFEEGLASKTAPKADSNDQPPPAGLREQIAAAIAEAAGDRWPAQAFLTEADAVLAVILPNTRITASIARDADATVQRVIDLYERWVAAGPPPLGTSVSRWWDRRLAELHAALEPTKEQ